MDCDTYQGVNIKVVGVGGCGGNTVNHMITSGMKGVEFIVLNTDRQELKKSMAKYSFNIGQKVTGGRGAGADPDKGRRSAEENRKEITALLKGAHMVFIAAGMGGGTGTGAAPVVAEVARELGILTGAVVTKPFDFDGKEAKAEQGIEELKKHVDSLLVIPNQRMVDLGEKNGADITFKDAKAAVNDVLYDGVRSISDLI
ncbi:MAG: cell division protein FtsZ, partial [Oscillospiraceae bacterium]|nr:cell division protein FtsZ [Oscillospiraceae bacterium]